MSVQKTVVISKPETPKKPETTTEADIKDDIINGDNTDTKQGNDEHLTINDTGLIRDKSNLMMSDIKGGKLYKNVKFNKDINILILEQPNINAVYYLVSQGYTVETYDLLSYDELKKKLPKFHAIGIRCESKLDKTMLEEYGKNLMCIGCFCIGTDTTDLNVCTNRGIPVFNSPSGNTRSVAELVLANILLLARQAGDQNRKMHNAIWNKTSENMHEVLGKTLGIIGYGPTGTQLSRLAEAIGLHVIYYDIFPKKPVGNAKQIESIDLLLKQSTFVSLHVPYNKHTHHLISEQQILRMKRGSYLLNASRGKVVDVNAAAKYLKNGYLGGAYFDVFPEEPITKNCVLINCPNTNLSPHVGGSTIEAQQNIGIEVAQKLVNYIEYGSTKDAVNIPQIEVKKSVDIDKILNFHTRKKGFMKSVMNILSDYDVNMQHVNRYKTVGYMVIEINKNDKISKEIKTKLDNLECNILTRIIKAKII